MKLPERALRRFTGVSIGVKILGMVAVIVILLGLGVTLLVRARLQAELAASLEERGIAIGRDLAARSADLILTENTFALYQLIRDTLENNADMRYAFIVGPAGRVLGHSFGQSVPPDLLAVNRVEASAAYRVEVLASDEGLITDVAVPILGGRAGVARLGLSHHRLDEAVSEATRALVGVTAAALGLGLGIALALTRVLTRPVLELVEVARAVGRGDLTAQARKRMDDEIGELASAFNMMTDGLARSQAELLRRMRELGTLNATAADISAEKSLTAILQSTLDKVLDVMNLRAGWLFLVSDQPSVISDQSSVTGHRSSVAADGGQDQKTDDRSALSAHRPPATGPCPLTLVVQSGLSSAFAREEAELELGMCICAQVLREGRPLFVHDIRRECPRLSPEAIAAEGLACHASVPLIARDRVTGVMNVASAQARQFTPEELALLDSVGRQVGVAVENARLWEEVKRKDALRGQLLSQVISAQEAERRRIARELHDEAGQLLTTLLVGLRTLEQTPALSTAAAEHVADLKALAKSIFEEIHRLALELRPTALDQLGLVGAVESYVRDFGGRLGLQTDFEATDLEGLRLSGEAEMALYRMTQEALANVAKHAAASRVAVMFKRRNGSLVAVIEDDGRGFDVEAALRSPSTEGPHLGLFGMQERAALLGGRLTIESECGKGTTVFMEIPLNNLHSPIPQDELTRDQDPSSASG